MWGGCLPLLGVQWSRDGEREEVGKEGKKGSEQRNERRRDKREGRDVCGPREQTALLMLMLAGCRGAF